jgi:nicotinamidase-related amidase
MDEGFGEGLGFGSRPALLVIDFVKAYLNKGSPLYAGVEAVRDQCVELLTYARATGIPIFHTNVSYRPGSADGGVFRRKLPLLSVFEEGSAYADFVDGLEPFPAETVITKQYASAFFGTPLASSLTAQSIDTVIICGVTTSGCIRASAVDAVQHGFLPVVVREAVGDRDEAPHVANLFDLQAKYADVVPMNDVLAYLGALNSEPPA